MELKKPLLYEEQIKKLKGHGVVIEDEEKVKKILGHKSHMDFPLLSVAELRMTSIMMKKIFVIRKKMPLWVVVELMSFSKISKLYSSMYFSKQDAIASAIGTGRKTLENHLHCLAVLRNKCAHAARMYNTEFNPPARLSANFLRKYPELKNNSLFAYTLILMKRLPDEACKMKFLTALEAVLEEYQNDIDLKCVGFPQNYQDILRENL